jgi:hypothetical protein
LNVSPFSLAALGQLLKSALFLSQDLEPFIGKVKLLEDQDGMNGAAFDLPLQDAQV